MKRIDWVLENGKVKTAEQVKEFITGKCCPFMFGLRSPCEIAFVDEDKAEEYCRKCWNEEMEE